MKLFLPSLRLPVLAAGGALLLVLVPTAWLAARLQSDAAQRDEARLGELVAASRKALTAESGRHQRLLQTWRSRLEAEPVLDESAWAKLFDGPEATRLGRFRAVGCAVWEGEEKLMVKWVTGTAAGEGFPAGANLAADPGVRDALARERKDRLGLIASTSRMKTGVGGRPILALTSFQREPSERGVLFALLLPEIFLAPMRTVSHRVNPDHSLGERVVQETSLPGVAEGMVRIEPVSAEERKVASASPTLGLNGPMGDLNLVFRPGPNFARDSLAGEARLVAAAGALVALLLAAHSWVLARQREVLTERVAARTAQLASVQEGLRAALENERELLRLKSEFVNTVSHEFRTPLCVILSSADLLANYPDRLAPEMCAEYLQDIQTSSRHMAQLLEQVLDLGRMEAGRFPCAPQPLELAAFLQRIADESHSAFGGEPIRLALTGELSGSCGDEALLRQVLLNLLSNARKYSTPEAPVELAAVRVGEEAIFTVRDEGIGIPAADFPRLFESFTRGGNIGDTPGTGLGLAIARRCAELHGGTLCLQSEEGRGTLATVRLPLFRTEPS